MLTDNTNPDDLTIFSFRDTEGGFYLGDVARNHMISIFKYNGLRSVIYLTRNTDEREITLKNLLNQSEKVTDYPDRRSSQ